MKKFYEAPVLRTIFFEFEAIADINVSPGNIGDIILEDDGE